MKNILREYIFLFLFHYGGFIIFHSSFKIQDKIFFFTLFIFFSLYNIKYDSEILILSELFLKK